MNEKQKWFIAGALAIILSLSFLMPVISLPAGPILNHISNSTAVAVSANRSQDAKGTITVISVSSTQQDYKWKAYVGNVTGTLALDDGSSYTIYDWSLGTPSGEVYVSRAASVNWPNITCANETVISSEQTAISMSGASADSINLTFNNSVHETFLVATKAIENSTCRSIATYVNDTVQTVSESATFQEILLADAVTGNLVYATAIENNALGYNAQTFDFQLLVAENESSDVPTTYYFYVELS